MNIPKNIYEQKKETLVFKNNIEIGNIIKSKFNIISNEFMCQKLVSKKYYNCLIKNQKISYYISVLLFFLISSIDKNLYGLFSLSKSCDYIHN